MAHSRARFIPLLLLITSAFYLLSEAGGKKAHNKAASPAVKPPGGIVGSVPAAANTFPPLPTVLIDSPLSLRSSYKPLLRLVYFVLRSFTSGALFPLVLI